jgi:hypothetical protein
MPSRLSFDRRQVFIGSLNLDPRALLQNTEIGVVIDQSDIAEGNGRLVRPKHRKCRFPTGTGQKRQRNGIDSLARDGGANAGNL